MSTTLTPTYGTKADLTVTGLTTLNNSLTSGWQSDVIDNRTAKASDYLVIIKATLGATWANDKCLYLYAIPWYHDGTDWIAGGDTGTATNNLTASGAAAGITITAVNNLGPPVAIINFGAASQAGAVVEFKLSNRFGSILPQGIQLFAINYGGSALTAVSISIVPITYLGV